MIKGASEIELKVFPEADFVSHRLCSIGDRIEITLDSYDGVRSKVLWTSVAAHRFTSESFLSDLPGDCVGRLIAVGNSEWLRSVVKASMAPGDPIVGELTHYAIYAVDLGLMEVIAANAEFEFSDTEHASELAAQEGGAEHAQLP